MEVRIDTDVAHVVRFVKTGVDIALEVSIYFRSYKGEQLPNTEGNWTRIATSMPVGDTKSKAYLSSGIKEGNEVITREQFEVRLNELAETQFGVVERANNVLKSAGFSPLTKY